MQIDHGLSRCALLSSVKHRRSHADADLASLAVAGVTSVAVQDDGSSVASGGDDGLVCISNLQTGRILGQLTGS